MKLPDIQVFKDLQIEILQLLEDQLSIELVYHNAEHTRMVLRAVQWLCAEENISDDEAWLVCTAAVFHDTGFLVSSDDHEKHSCDIARKYLTKKGIPGGEIDRIEGLILATRIPQQPRNLLEEILCDADLNYLGTDDFFVIGDRLRQELILLGKLDPGEESWLRFQIRFLDNHRYFTKTCQRFREPTKQEFLDELKAAVQWDANGR